MKKLWLLLMAVMVTWNCWCAQSPRRALPDYMKILGISGDEIPEASDLKVFYQKRIKEINESQASDKEKKAKIKKLTEAYNAINRFLGLIKSY